MIKSIGAVFFVFLLTVLAMVMTSCDPVASSHINANVPEGQDFHEYLKRDLEAHFSDSMGKQVTVDYELLRKAPTQSGVALPKYYAWVKISKGTKLLEEGAVRVAAVDKTHFDTTHYLSKDAIESAPEMIYQVFPAAVCDTINKKLQ